MTKQIKKSSGKMSMFRRLTLGNMICNYVGILLVAVALILQAADIRGNATTALAMVGLVSILVAIILAIAQIVEARHYGDIFGKLTRKNTTIIFTVFLAVGAGIFVAAMLASNLISGEGTQELKDIVQFIGAGFAVVCVLGYTITSTIAFAKSK